MRIVMLLIAINMYVRTFRKFRIFRILSFTTSFFFWEKELMQRMSYESAIVGLTMCYNEPVMNPSRTRN